jgi:hypothetical protein
VALILTIAVTTLCWVTTAYVGPQTDRQVLVEFYKKIRPFGPGWRQIRDQAGLGEDAARTAGDNIPLALLGWVAGCATIWSSLFTVGNLLYGRTGEALACLAVFAVAGIALVRVVSRLWEKRPVDAPRNPG